MDVYKTLHSSQNLMNDIQYILLHSSVIVQYSAKKTSRKYRITNIIVYDLKLLNIDKVVERNDHVFRWSRKLDQASLIVRRSFSSSP